MVHAIDHVGHTINHMARTINHIGCIVVPLGSRLFISYIGRLAEAQAIFSNL